MIRILIRRDAAVPPRNSWLNQVECVFAEPARRRLQRASFLGVPSFAPPSSTTSPRPFEWTASADTILGKVSHLCEEFR